MIDVVTVSLALVAATVFVKQVLAPADNAHLPPSPPSDPLIGNARVMPLEYAYRTFAEWRKTYGDVVYASVLGRPMLIVNSVAAARDLMEKRGAVYSDRPVMWVISVLMGWSNTLPFLPYGARFRKHRRMMQTHFNAHAVRAFVPIQASAVHGFLQRVLAKPEHFRKDVHRLIASSILMATFGHAVTTEDDPYIQLVNRTTKMTTDAGSPGGTIIDLFPALRHLPTWLPFMGLKRHALKTAELVNEVMEMPLRELREKRAAGTAPHCYVNHLLDEYEATGKVDKEHEEDIRAIGAVIYSAGAETSEATISAFFLMMARSPSIVARAQAEIDSVVGVGADGAPLRLPTLDDRARMPYLECIVKEVFRFNPAVPIGIPHASTRDDVYRGWTIPGKSMVLPNIWCMMRDEKYYPEPETFRPERFLEAEERKCVNAGNALSVSEDSDDYSDDVGAARSSASASLSSAMGAREDDPTSIVFGFGRRLCPGRHFADSTMWLTYACFLAAFNIGPAVNEETGEREIPEVAFASGTSSNALPFKCSITPRSEAHARLVLQMQPDAY